ncbi:hypothetical protein SEVIR_9G396300v4 [Setaria viridis]|nr:agamous-like MADS-box protein AGL29 [Setaria viridis]
MVKGKTSMGRQKIEMKKIESEEARSVCFSKRRAGMFKKAAELSILCGAMVAIVVFSPSGRPFSFGSPSFKAVYNRFRTLIDPAISGESCDGSSEETNTTHELLEYSELEQSIEGEKKRKKRLDETIIERDIDARVMDLLTTEVYSSGLDDLQEFHKKLVAIQDIVKEKIKQVMQEERHPTRPYPPAFIDLVSKYMLDMQIDTHISSTTLNSNHTAADGLDVNGPSTSSVHAVGTSVNYPSNQLDG